MNFKVTIPRVQVTTRQEPPQDLRAWLRSPEPNPSPDICPACHRRIVGVVKHNCPR